MRMGQIRPHDPKDMITYLAPVIYDPKASCERFDRFLLEVMEGNSAMADFLLRLLGMCLTADVSEQILPIFWGEGSNGKSVLLDTIRRALGDYACNGAPDLLIRKRGDTHPTETADLQGRRLVICAENEKNAALRIQFIKLLTGDDVLKARFMRQDFFSFKRTHKTVLVTNNRPSVDEDTHAVWRRLRLVPFARTFKGDECDPHLLETLWAERSGILNRLVRGCLDWQRGGLCEPSEVLTATAEYRKSQSPLEDFIAERITADPIRFVSVADMAVAYSEWCEDHDATPISPRQFNADMRQRGFVYQTIRDAGELKKVWEGAWLRA
jgi:putative DNA primase/helicase